MLPFFNAFQLSRLEARLHAAKEERLNLNKDMEEQGDSDEECLEQQRCSSGEEECGRGGACQGEDRGDAGRIRIKMKNQAVIVYYTGELTVEIGLQI